MDSFSNICGIIHHKLMQKFCLNSAKKIQILVCNWMKQHFGSAVAPLGLC